MFTRDTETWIELRAPLWLYDEDAAAAAFDRWVASPFAAVGGTPAKFRARRLWRHGAPRYLWRYNALTGVELDRLTRWPRQYGGGRCWNTLAPAWLRGDPPWLSRGP